MASAESREHDVLEPRSQVRGDDEHDEEDLRVLEGVEAPEAGRVLRRGRGVVRVSVEQDLTRGGTNQLRSPRADVEVLKAQDAHKVVGLGRLDRPHEPRRRIDLEVSDKEAGRAVPGRVRGEVQAEAHLVARKRADVVLHRPPSNGVRKGHISRVRREVGPRGVRWQSRHLKSEGVPRIRHASDVAEGDVRPCGEAKVRRSDAQVHVRSRCARARVVIPPNQRIAAWVGCPRGVVPVPQRVQPVRHQNRMPVVLSLDGPPRVKGPPAGYLGQIEHTVERVREDDIGEPEPPVLRQRLRVEDEPNLEARCGVPVRADESVRASVDVQAPLEEVHRGDPHEPDLGSCAPRLQLLFEQVRVVVRFNRLEPSVPKRPDPLVRDSCISEARRDRPVLVEQVQDLRPEDPGLVSRQGPREMAPAAEASEPNELEVRRDPDAAALSIRPIDEINHREGGEKREEKSPLPAAEHDGGASKRRP